MPAEQAIADLLDALGVDRHTEALRHTPRRVAATFGELLRPGPIQASAFPNDDGYDAWRLQVQERLTRRKETTS